MAARQDMSQRASGADLIRVLHVITGLDVGGAERALVRFVTASQREEVQHVVVSLKGPGRLARDLQEAGIPVVALELNRLKKMIPGLIRFRRILGSVSPEIVQTWMYHADVIGGIVAWLSGHRRILWGLQMSDLSEGDKLSTRVLVRLGALLSKHLPARILACAEEARRVHVRMGYPDGKISVVPYGFVPGRRNEEAAKSFRDAHGIPDGNVVIGRAARFHPMKDYENLAKVIESVILRRREVTFVLCGEGVTTDNPRFGELLNRYPAHIRLLGRVDDMDSFYSAIDIACSSSAYGEGLPNVIGEAMAIGIPVVTTDVGDSAVLVGDTGMVVAPRDPEGLAGAIIRMIDLGEEERTHLGSRARTQIQEHFTLSRMVDAYHDVYRQLIG